MRHKVSAVAAFPQKAICVMSRAKAGSPRFRRLHLFEVDHPKNPPRATVAMEFYEEVKWFGREQDPRTLLR